MIFEDRDTSAGRMERSGTAAEALEYRLRQQKLVADFGMIALRTSDLQALLQEATRLCAEGLQTKFCKIMEYLPDERCLVVRAGVGWKPGTIGARTEADPDSPSGYAVSTGEPVISVHLDGEGRFRTPHLLAEHGVTRAINIAIPRGSERYGVLEGDSATDGQFDEWDIAFLQGFANLIGAALERNDNETSLARANAQLIAQGERLRQLFEQSPGFMAVLRGPAHVFELTNDAFLQVVGHRDLVGKTVRDGLPDVEGQGFYELLDRVYATGEPFVGRGLAIRVQASPDAPAEDRFVDFVYQPITDVNGTVTGIFVEGSDVTEAKRSEAALRESEARLRIAQEAGGIGTYEWDLGTGELWVSDVMRRLWGLPREGAVSLSTAVGIVHPEDRHRVLSESDRPLEETVVYTEYRIVRPDTGETRWMARRGEILRDDDGTPRRVIGAFYDITDRVTAEVELRASRERLERALDAAEMGAWELNLSTKTAWRSLQHDRIFGYDAPLPQWTYEIFLEHVVPEDRSAVDRAFQDAVAHRHDWGFECRIRRLDGEIRWIWAQGRMELDERQEPLRLKGMVRDVTERKLADDALAASEVRLAEERTRLRTLVDHLPVGVNFVDRDGRTLLANPAFRDFVPNGVIPSRLPDGDEHWIAYDEQGRRLGRDQFPAARALRGEVVHGVEFLHRSADGQETWTRVSGIPLRDASGEVTGALAVTVDIDAQKRAQEALAQLNENLEAEIAERTEERDRIWHNSNELMGVFGFDGRRRSINPAWSRVLGIDAEALLNSPFMEITHPDDRDRLAEAVKRLAQGEPIVEFEDRIRHADGSYRTISWTGVPGEGVFYAIGRDVTEHRHAEDALRQAQKMEAVGQLTGGVAHDFNNLLTIIRSSTDLLRRPDLPEERRRRYVDAIADTVDRASKLTGQLLAFARRQALKPEVFDVAERIRAVADIMRTIMGSRIQIVTHIGCERCFVEADVSQFETALINMAVNARDAMDGEGTVTVRVDDLPQIPTIRGHRGGPGRFVAVSLSDTGSGIPPNRIAQIFEPFFTTKEVGKGTGLGLSQVYGFAKQSGGDVDVESEVGHGTTFTLYLPRVEQEAADSVVARKETASAEHGQGRRVLVVEDNIEVGTFSTQLLQDLGYETIWASNAHEALTRLGEAEGRFDVVFSDVVMPGMSGVELGKEIRQRYPGLPVVLTSGYSDVLAEEGRHGFELLQKPYAAEELSRILRRVTRGRATA